METNLKALAQIVDDAARHARAVPQLSAARALSLADAYEVQRASIELREERGENRIGLKMGFTSRAKMLQMGIDDVIWGRLTDAMLVEEGGTISFAHYIHPRVEPEVAFLLRESLPGKVTAAQALESVAAVAPALEIIDSRYQDFKFSLPDVVADNASSSGLVIGPWCAPNTDLGNLGMLLELDGRVRQIGSSAAILGHPLRSLVAAARLAAEAGEPLQRGWIVMAGGATAAEALSPGMHVRCVVESLGSCSFRVGSAAEP